MEHEVSIRPMQPDEFRRVVDYFHDASDEHLLTMGVDRKRLPGRQEWEAMLKASNLRPDSEKDRCYVVWMVDGYPAGHSNINDIEYGETGSIHLHMWVKNFRRSGLGAKAFMMSARYFAARFQLKSIYCEPHAKNPAPNATLRKLGWALEKTYRTVPGPVSFEQEVNRYRFHIVRDD